MGVASRQRRGAADGGAVPGGGRGPGGPPRGRRGGAGTGEHRVMKQEVNDRRVVFLIST